MNPWLIEMVMRIVRTAIVSHPLIVLGVHVRNLRMACFVRSHVVLWLRRGLLASRRRRHRGRFGCLRRSRAVRRNVSAPYLGVPASAWALIPAASLILRKCSNAK